MHEPAVIVARFIKAGEADTELTGSMHTARDTYTLTVLQNGQGLAAGGETQDKKGNFFYTNTAEVYTP